MRVGWTATVAGATSSGHTGTTTSPEPSSPAHSSPAPTPMTVAATTPGSAAVTTPAPAAPTATLASTRPTASPGPAPVISHSSVTSHGSEATIPVASDSGLSDAIGPGDPSPTSAGTPLPDAGAGIGASSVADDPALALAPRRAGDRSSTNWPHAGRLHPRQPPPRATGWRRDRARPCSRSPSGRRVQSQLRGGLRRQLERESA